MNLERVEELCLRYLGQAVNPLVPVDLVIDHSVQVDEYANPLALLHNTEREFQRNRERYEFLKWGQKAFKNFSVVPPSTGITVPVRYAPARDAR